MNLSVLPICILPFSASSQNALNSKLKLYKDFLVNNPQVNLHDLAFSLGTKVDFASSDTYKVALIGKDSTEILEQLENFDFETETEGISEQRKKLCFLFPGHGSVYPGMGQLLYDTSPIYRAEFDKLDMMLHGKENIFGQNKEKVTNPALSTTSIFHTEVCLFKLWKSWGVEPDVILPHSIGEYAAGVCSEIVKQDDMVTFILLGVNGDTQRFEVGAMIVVVADVQKTEELITSFLLLQNPKNKQMWIDIAVENTSNQTIVSGTDISIPLFTGFCKSKRIRTVPLPFSHPLHTRHFTPYMDSAKTTSAWTVGEPTLPYFSSVTGSQLTSQDLPDYWINHGSNRCRFRTASEKAYEDGSARIFLEIGPHPITSGLVIENIDDLGGEEITCLPSLAMQKNDWETILNSLKELWSIGVPINWKGFYEAYKGNSIELPTSPPDFDFIKSQIVSQIKIVLKLPKSKAIDDDCNLKELGMESLQAIQLKSKLQRLIGKGLRLEVNDMFDCHTLQQLTTRVYEILTNTRKDDTKQKRQELIELSRKDGVLWSHIKADAGSKPPVLLDDVKTIFVTGATGNLTPYILEWLIKNRLQTTKIYCLLRGQNVKEATDRLVNHLTQMHLQDRINMGKIVVLIGDISGERFGLDQDTYERLSEEVDAVVNCAVAANHLAHYRENDSSGVRATNVIGAQRVFEFAASRKIKHVFHGTTVLGLWNNLNADCSSTSEDDGKMPENWPKVEQIDELIPDFGYGISKLIADDLARQAVENGIPVKAFMYPKINGDSLDGRMGVMKNHFFVKFIHYLVEGQMPNTEIPLNLLPVDVAADVSLRVFFNPAAPPDIYYVLNPHLCYETEIAGLYEEFGPILRIIVELSQLDMDKEGLEKFQTLNLKSIDMEKIKEFLNNMDPKWIQNMEVPLEDERVTSFLKAEFGHQKMKFLEYNDFVSNLVEQGENSLLYNWIEFYTREDSLFRIASQGTSRLYNLWLANPKETIRGGRMEKYLPNLAEIIEHPLITLRRDFRFTIKNAKDIFKNKNNYY